MGHAPSYQKDVIAVTVLKAVLTTNVVFRLAGFNLGSGRPKSLCEDCNVSKSAAALNPPDHEKYRTIEDAQEIRRILKHIVGTSARVQFQVDGFEPKFTALLSDSSSSANGIHLITDAPFKKEALNVALKDAPLTEVAILITLPGQVLLGFKAHYKFNDGATSQFTYPSKLLRIQRRKDARLSILSGYDIQVLVDSVLRARARDSYRLLDLSISGLGFLVATQEEADRFYVGLMMKDIRFTLQNQAIHVDAQVKSQVPTGPESRHRGIKIGVQFIRASQADKDQIAKYIFENMPYSSMI